MNSFLIILMIAFVIYILVYMRMRQSIAFINRGIDILDFHREMDEYSGYIIFSDEAFITAEADLMRRLYHFLNIDSCCVLVLVEVASSKPSPEEVAAFKAMSVSSIPSISYFEKGKKTKDIFDYQSFPYHFDKSQLQAI